MFSFFKDKSRQNQVRELLDGFQDGFSIEQKAAITRYMLGIAKCTGHINNKEEEYIENTALMLGFQMNDPALIISLNQGVGIMIECLKVLSIAQKMWIVVSVRELLQINGKIDDVKFQYASKILGYIGVTDEILSKIQNLK